MNTPTLSRGWYFLLSYVAFSAYSLDFIMRLYLGPQLKSLYNLAPHSLGSDAIVNAAGQLIGVLIFGCLVDKINFKTCFIWVWILQILGLIKLALLSPQMSAQTLQHNCIVSMLLMGIGEGGIFAIIHPLVTLAFHHPDRSKINIMHYLHTNWPLMIMLVCFLEWYVGKNQVPLTTNVYMMFVFPCLYLMLALIIPLPKRASDHPIRLSSKIRFTLRPGFVLLFFCMAFTSTIEHSPRTLFVDLYNNKLHVSQVHFILFYCGIQAVLRLSCSFFTRWISPPGLLGIAAIISCIGLFILAQNISITADLIGLGLFSFSNAWYWPSFITIAIDRYPLSGSFGMALMNGGGYLSYMFFVPRMTQLSMTQGVNQAFYTLSWYAGLVVILLGAIYAFFRSQGGYKVMASSEASV